MSRIDELIKEYCPDGVEYVHLGDITGEHTARNKDRSILDVRSVTNSSGLVRTEDFFDNTRTSADTSNYKKVEPGMIVYNPSRINVGSIARNLEAVQVIVSPMYVVVSVDSSKIDPDYLDYFLSSQKGKQQILGRVEVGARFRFTYQSFARIRIPLPPIEVQKKIVNILDKFTQLEAELSAEVNARRKQYEYYCTKLLTAGTDVPVIELGSILQPKGYIRGPFGSALKKAFFIESGVPIYEQQHAIYGTREFRYYIDLERASKLKRFYVKPDDIIISCSGTIGRISIIRNDDPEGIINQALLILRLDLSKVKVRYVKYYLECFPGLIISNTGGAITNIEKREVIQKIKIPLPSLVEQDRLIEIIDKFETLTSDISGGLPAEINARRQQYEYYRSKLLTFQELSV